MNFNPRSTYHKSIYGPIKAKEDGLVLRIWSKEKKQAARVFVTSPDGEQSIFSMTLDKALSTNGFVYCLSIPADVFSQIGVYSYYFGYFEAGQQFFVSCGCEITGDAVISTECFPYSLSVYDPALKVPDWFKKQCFYHVFVDRFYGAVDRSHWERNKAGYLETFSDGSHKNKRSPINTVKHAFGTYDGSQEIVADPLCGHTMYGGDLQGIKEKSDYLLDLGVTALYLSPVFWADSNHKYDASDYMSLDPQFGVEVLTEDGQLDPTSTQTANDLFFKQFCDHFAQRGVRIMLDGVFNHCGAASVYFNRDGESPTVGAYPFHHLVNDLILSKSISKTQAQELARDTFRNEGHTDPDAFSYVNLFEISNTHFQGSDLYEYSAWAEHTNLPSFRRAEKTPGDNDGIVGLHLWNNIDFRELMFGNGFSLDERHQASIAKDTVVGKWSALGCSSWRMDAVSDISMDSWKKICRNIKSLEQETDEPVILGELWNVSPEYALGNAFHSITNYPLKFAFDDFFTNGDGKRFFSQIDRIRDAYPKEIFHSLFNMLSSHDVQRAYRLYGRGASALAARRLACGYSFLLTLPGVPAIYYGDEVALDGGNDPDCRRPFPWGLVKKCKQGYHIDGEGNTVHSAIKNMLSLRKQHDVLREGDLSLLYCDQDALVLLRKHESTLAIVSINRSEHGKTVQIHEAPKIPNGIKLHACLDEEALAPVHSGFSLALRPLNVDVWMGENKGAISIHPVEFIDALSEGELYWSVVRSATSYRIYTADTPFEMEDNHYWVAGVTHENHFSFNDQKVGLYFRIAACNNDGESPPSPCMLVGTLSPLPQTTKERLSISSRGDHFALSRHSQDNTSLRVYRRDFDTGEISATNGQFSKGVLCDYDVCSSGNYQYSLFDFSRHLYCQSEWATLKEQMVKVIINVHTPKCTPEGDGVSMLINDVTIPLRPLGGSAHQYIHYEKEGSCLRDFSFVRNGSKYRRGLAFLSGDKGDIYCPSHWGFFDFTSNFNLTALGDQSGECRLDVYINRWADQPIVPIATDIILGGDNNNTDQETLELSLSVPFDTILSINDTQIKEQGGKVNVSLPLSLGENLFYLKLDLYGDWHSGQKDRAYQQFIQTKTTLLITRTR